MTEEPKQRNRVQIDLRNGHVTVDSSTEKLDTVVKIAETQAKKLTSNHQGNWGIQ